MFTYTNWRYEEDYRHYRLEYIMWKLWQIHQKPCQINRAIFWKVEQFHLVVKMCTCVIDKHEHFYFIIYYIYMYICMSAHIFYTVTVYYYIQDAAVLQFNFLCTDKDHLALFYLNDVLFHLKISKQVPLVTQFEV